MIGEIRYNLDICSEIVLYFKHENTHSSSPLITFHFLLILVTSVPLQFKISKMSSFPLKRNSNSIIVLKTPVTPKRKSSLHKRESLTNTKELNNDLNILYNSNNQNVFKFKPNKKISEGDYFTVYLICRNTNELINMNMNMNDILRETKDICNCSESDECNTILKISKLEVNRSQLKEIEILSQLKNCKNILQLYSAWTFKNILYVETEYCQLLTLQDLINNVYVEKKSFFSDKLIYFILISLCKNLDILEKNKIMHCDICPCNIFISLNKKHNKNEFEELRDYYQKREISFNHPVRIVLGDFNISKMEYDKLEYEGTPKYLPPETLLSQYNFSSDLYSLILIWLELKEGIELPSYGNIWQMLRKGKFQVKNLDNAEEKLMRRFFYKLEDRPSRKEVLKFFRKKYNSLIDK